MTDLSAHPRVSSPLPAWEEEADRVCDAVLKRAPDMLRKVSETLYEQMLYDVQDYLRDNVKFNLASRLAGAEVRAKRAEAALAALGWQDISTAPKDGTPIDVWAFREKSGVSSRYTDIVWSRRNFGSEPVGDPCWVGFDDQYSKVIPSHWMPRPAPPFGSGRTLADATP